MLIKYSKLRLLGSNFTKSRDKIRSQGETNIHMNIIGAKFVFSPKLVFKKYFTLNFGFTFCVFIIIVQILC